MSIAFTTPQAVLYCGACGMPPEYCSYGPDFKTHCVPWLKLNHPAIFARLHGIAKGRDAEGTGRPLLCFNGHVCLG